MKLPLAIAGLLLFISGRAAAEELLNPPDSPGALLNGKVDIASNGFMPRAWNSDIGRYEEDTIFAGNYVRSGAIRYWGGGSVPVWRSAVSGPGSGVLLGSLAKGPGGVPTLRIGTIRGVSGLVVRSR